jgi:hypothetical protein
MASTYSTPNPNARGATKGRAVDSLAAIAARLCGASLSDVPEPPIPQGGNATGPHLPWRRAPRTKAALALKVLAIEKAIGVLEYSRVPYTQPLSGKLVIEPPAGIEGAKTVTFWPAKERLRIGRRATKTQMDIHAFEQALADQGHRMSGYLPRPARRCKVSKEERSRARREADLAEMDQAYGQWMEFYHQALEDLAAGRRIRRRDPRSARAKRLFKRARS